MKTKKLLSVSTFSLALLMAGCSAISAFSQSPTKNKVGALPTQSESSAEVDMEKSGSAVYEQQKKDGSTVYSIEGGNTWLSKEDFEKEYPTHSIEWWTYDEYAEYIEQQKVSLQEMVDNQATGYTDQRGYFTWTQELADETVQKYEQDLEQIKNGVKISKSIEGLDDDCAYESYSLAPKGLPTVSFEVSLPDDSTKQFTGDDKAEVYETVKDFCNQQMKSGKLTQKQVDSILNEVQ